MSTVRPGRQRSTLGARIAALCVAIAVVTGALAGVLAVELIRSADTGNARRTLAELADATQTSAAHNGLSDSAQEPVRRLLQTFAVRYAVMTSAGQIVGATLVSQALTGTDITTLRSHQSISVTRSVAGHEVYVEGRPTNDGGAVVLAQRSIDATAAGQQAVRRVLLAILISVVIAIGVGLLVARRLSRPLRRTAAAAHALAAGSRDVAVAPQGPREVAGVAEAVNTLADALTHSEARQREFLLSVSHELRTPLTAITGYAESIADGVIPPEQAAEAGGIVLSEARRLERLVGDLLDLARLDSADFRIEAATVDLGELAAVASQVWQARCAEVGVLFATELPPYAVLARTDAGRVRQIVDGLLENALRVTPAGAPIVLAVRSDPDRSAVVEVRDGGPGLTDDDLAVAFRRAELYQRYRGVRRVGTGLGLAIVHGLTTRLGGTVQAGHAGEGGARFTVRLPPA